MSVHASRVDVRVLGRWAFDAVVAVVATQVAVSLTFEALVDAGPARRGAALLLAFMHGAVLILRRRLPRTVVAVVVATALAYVAIGLRVYFLGPASVVAVYTLAALCDRRSSLVGLGVAQFALLAGAVTGGVQWDSWALYSVVLAGAWLLGAALRRWQQTAREQAERAEQLARARDELARLAVTEERVRIARELHDIVAHGMSVVAVQAATARLVVHDDPARAADALAAIEVTTRSALDEMRQLLAVLREEGDGQGRLDPTPGLADLHGLVARMAKAGLTVTVDLSGDTADVPAGVGLACYRIVQEALTNALRHAGQTRVVVTVACTGDAVDLEVRDRGTAPVRDDAGGQGTIGMRERALLYGGTFSAGPHPGGGWCVRAQLPYRPRPQGVPA